MSSLVQLWLWLRLAQSEDVEVVAGMRVPD
jgi:hypothetical protein